MTAAQAKPAIAKPARVSASTVTVYCKVPNGLRLQLQRQIERPLPLRDGTVSSLKEWVRTGPVHFVRGPAAPVGTPPKGYAMPQIEFGFAATPGVPADFWDAWLEQNKTAAYVTTGMVYAEAEEADGRAVAREHEKLLSGLEPIRPDDPTERRMPRSLNPNVQNLQKLDAR